MGAIAVEDSEVAVPEATLEDLAERLARIRLADRRRQGRLALRRRARVLEELVAHRREGGDWRATSAR